MRRHCVADSCADPESYEQPDLLADGSSYTVPSGDTHQRDRRRLHPMRSRPPSLCQHQQQQYRHKK